MTREVSRAPQPSLTRFTLTAETVANEVIGAYSTSFGMATRLLGKMHRTHVRNIYALVRVADEIVDGVASEAGLTQPEQAEALIRYKNDTHQAMRSGYSSDLVIHAFARTAREAGIDETLTQPFFDSMLADVTDADAAQTGYDRDAHAAYVYGSAEVVGLMCLSVFLRDSSVNDAERDRLVYGARRLGAAFQNINFLRDLADDTGRLGRSYLGADGKLDDNERDRWVAEIREQLSDAENVIPLLPADARAAVRSASALFTALTRRVARTPAADLYRKRMRVPGPIKLGLVAQAMLVTLKEGRS